MKTTLRSISKIKPYANNPRKNDGAVDAVAASIKEFGFRQPIVVDNDGVIVVGHTRWKAAQSLGIDKVPVHVATDLTPEQCRAYRIADNKTVELADWDLDLLTAEIDAMPDVDWSSFGFTDDELHRDVEGLTDPDDVPEPPADPVTKPGDLIVLGEHRLLCGDSTKAEDVGRLMDGAKADACVTDPPYGIGVDYDTFDDSADNVKRLIDGVMPFILACGCAALTPGFPTLWFYPIPSWLGAWCHPAPNGRCSWGFYGSQSILYYGSDPYLKAGKGGRSTCVIMAAGREGVEGHPTPKPIKVWAWLVERCTVERGALVFDPFLGSGTTMIAAEQLKRRCFGMEISPVYCDVIVDRWTAFTGKKAKR